MSFKQYRGFNTINSIIYITAVTHNSQFQVLYNICFKCPLEIYLEYELFLPDHEEHGITFVISNSILRRLELKKGLKAN